ncbi:MULTISPECIES: hypothetical protein [Mesobacillus]|uniref:RNA polymerase subunit sigma n=2 Tax=Mesobacillus TaxID=2675231 RepID=A0A0D6Z6W5_9BACI|nr:MULTISPECIES: hypothetical protein [Mesobacillus]KIY21514.1 hypothetical protein UB32_13300 [Mesobacillus subterraneus]MDQ0412479.1 DNA-binding transcriptional MerR regulator [Mesobacillus stamsii]
MSLKAIEMQIALPRTQDAGKIQEQLQQRGQHLQEHAVKMVTKEEDLTRNTVVKNNQKQEARLNKEGSHQGDQEQKNRENHENKDDEIVQQHHPYKGKVIDYSG